MGITERLLMIHENVDEVHEAGYNKGYQEGEEAGLNAGGYTEGFEAGKQEGKQEEYDAFWDEYQLNGKRETWQYGAFSGIGWNDKTFKPKYPIIAINVYGMFQDTYITEINNIDFSLATSFNSVFAYSFKVKKIGEINIPNATRMDASFIGCTGLETIEKLIVGQACTFTNTFNNCTALKNIVFEGVIGNDINFQWSTRLTEASITSIVEALSESVDYSEGKTLTLSKKAVDDAFAWYFYDPVTEEGFEVKGTDESNPNWWPIRNRRLNWTIVYAE